MTTSRERFIARIIAIILAIALVTSSIVFIIVTAGDSDDHYDSNLAIEGVIEDDELEQVLEQDMEGSDAEEDDYYYITDENDNEDMYGDDAVIGDDDDDTYEDDYYGDEYDDGYSDDEDDYYGYDDDDYSYGYDNDEDNNYYDDNNNEESDSEEGNNEIEDGNLDQGVGEDPVQPDLPAMPSIPGDNFVAGTLSVLSQDGLSHNAIIEGYTNEYLYATFTAASVQGAFDVRANLPTGFSLTISPMDIFGNIIPTHFGDVFADGNFTSVDMLVTISGEASAAMDITIPITFNDVTDYGFRYATREISFVIEEAEEVPETQTGNLRFYNSYGNPTASMQVEGPVNQFIFGSVSAHGFIGELVVTASNMPEGFDFQIMLDDETDPENIMAIIFVEGMAAEAIDAQRAILTVQDIVDGVVAQEAIIIATITAEEDIVAYSINPLSFGFWQTWPGGDPGGTPVGLTASALVPIYVHNDNYYFRITDGALLHYAVERLGVSQQVFANGVLTNNFVTVNGIYIANNVNAGGVTWSGTGDGVIFGNATPGTPGNTINMLGVVTPNAANRHLVFSNVNVSGTASQNVLNVNTGTITISGNTTIQGGQNGIHLSGAANLNMHGGTITGNSGHGIYMASNSTGTVNIPGGAGVSITNNGLRGVHWNSDRVALPSHAFTANTILHGLAAVSGNGANLNSEPFINNAMRDANPNVNPTTTVGFSHAFNDHDIRSIGVNIPDPVIIRLNIQGSDPTFVGTDYVSFSVGSPPTDGSPFVAGNSIVVSRIQSVNITLNNTASPYFVAGTRPVWNITSADPMASMPTPNLATNQIQFENPHLSSSGGLIEINITFEAPITITWAPTVIPGVSFTVDGMPVQNGVPIWRPVGEGVNIPVALTNTSLWEEIVGPPSTGPSPIIDLLGPEAQHIVFEAPPMGVSIVNDFETLTGRSVELVHSFIYHPGTTNPIALGDNIIYILDSGDMPGTGLDQFELTKIEVSTVDGELVSVHCSNLGTRQVEFDVNEYMFHIVTFHWNLRRFDVTVNYLLNGLPAMDGGTPITRTIPNVRFGDNVALMPEEARIFGGGNDFWYNDPVNNPFYGHEKANPAWTLAMGADINTTIANAHRENTVLNNVRAGIGINDINVFANFTPMLRTILFDFDNLPTTVTNTADFNIPAFNPIRAWNTSVSVPVPTPPGGWVFTGWTVSASRPESLADAWATAFIDPNDPSLGTNWNLAAAQAGGPFTMPTTNLTFRPNFVPLNLVPQLPGGIDMPDPLNLGAREQGYALADLVAGVNIRDFTLTHTHNRNVTGLTFQLVGGATSPFEILDGATIFPPTSPQFTVNVGPPSSRTFTVRPILGLTPLNATTPRTYEDTIRIYHNGVFVDEINVVFRVDPRRFTVNIEHWRDTDVASSSILSADVVGYAPSATSPISTDGVFVGTNVNISAGAYPGHRVLRWEFFDENTGNPIEVPVVGMSAPTNSITLINPLISTRTIAIPGDGVDISGSDIIARAIWVNDDDVRYSIYVRHYLDGVRVADGLHLTQNPTIYTGVFGDVITGISTRPQSGFQFWRVAPDSPSITSVPTPLTNAGLTIGTATPPVNTTRTVSFTMPNDVVILEAHWVPTITIMVESETEDGSQAAGFYANDGQGNFGGTITDVAQGRTIQVFAGTKPGYGFAGWTLFYDFNADVQITGAALVGLSVGNLSSPRTTFIAPSHDVLWVANWVPQPDGGDNGDDNGGDNGGDDNGGDNGSTNGETNGSTNGSTNGGGGQGANGGTNGGGSGGGYEYEGTGNAPNFTRPSTPTRPSQPGTPADDADAIQLWQLGGHARYIVNQDGQLPYYPGDAVPGPFFGINTFDNDTHTPQEVADGVHLPGDILADANVPGIVQQGIVNPSTGDEQNVIGLIASAAGLLLSSIALFVLVVAKRKDHRGKGEKHR